jgi:hypothetical protein
MKRGFLFGLGCFLIMVSLVCLGMSMGKQSAKKGKKAVIPQPKKQDDSNGRDVGMSVDGFRTQLRREVENVCRDLGTNYDKEQERGFAFEVWSAELLLRIEGTDADPADLERIPITLKHSLRG